MSHGCSVGSHIMRRCGELWLAKEDGRTSADRKALRMNAGGIATKKKPGGSASPGFVILLSAVGHGCGSAILSDVLVGIPDDAFVDPLTGQSLDQLGLFGFTDRIEMVAILCRPESIHGQGAVGWLPGA